MKGFGTIMVTLLLLLGFAHAAAEQTPLERLESIVKIKSYIAPDARTKDSLGKEREGSGVLIDTEGHILTIGYVILEAEAIEVMLGDGQSTVASYVGYDHDTGFGLIKVDPPPELKPIQLGRSAGLEPGDPVLLAGRGGDKAIRPARVIARRAFVGYWEYLLEDAFYVAPPHPEFAGAAMLDENGRLVGIGSIYTQLVSPQYGAVPCNMFVPIDLLKPILTDLIQKGRSGGPSKPWLGFNANETRGRVFVERIHKDSPAEAAGLKENDIVVSVNKAPVEGLADLYRKVWALGKAGVGVSLTVLQGSHLKNIEIQSGDRYLYLRIRPTLKAPRQSTERVI